MPGAFAKVFSFGVYGIDAYQVAIELDVSITTKETETIFQIVGLPEGAVKESRERVRAAIGNSGFWFPGGRITANMAPADIRKEGAAFDLPLAIGVLAATSAVPGDRLTEYALVGELGLDGELRPIRGALPLALGAKHEGMRGILVPQANADEAAIVEGLAVIPVASLTQAVRFLSAELDIAPHVSPPFGQSQSEEDRTHGPDMSEIRGQTGARRALEVAAAGGHNLLMIGPPGSGKTMLARRLPSILPTMTFEESIETTKIHSIAGLVGSGGLITTRPFRSPHHTISDVAMVGGGTIPRPGEVSLSHHGVLYLDEIPEFPRSALEALRQPLEDGVITVTRSTMAATFPAKSLLCGSCNPCACGFLTDNSGRCHCTPVDVQRYRARLSGPLLDRIDIHIDVPAVKYQEMTRGTPGESSAQVRERVQRARDVQTRRFAGVKGVHCNAHMRHREIQKYCKLDEPTLALLERAMANLNLSARAFDRILKVARTIADLDGKESIQGDHISEAIHYRSLDRGTWR